LKKISLVIFAFSSLFSELLLDKSPFKELPNDINNYFSIQNMSLLFIGFTIGGTIANSTADQAIYDFYQNNIRSKNSNNFLNIWKKMGQDEVLLVYGGLSLFSFAATNTKAGSFTKDLLFNTTRAFIVGTVPLEISRVLTGGSRPIYSDKSSYWIPLSSFRGVSGHTYTGAILFLSWAKMVDGISYKALLYGLSTLTGLSRINDGFHYPSQVFLGWLMAYAACDVVDKTNSNLNLYITAERVSLSFEF
jgi:membrane-associated phospholipid phosphatase